MEGLTADVRSSVFCLISLLPSSLCTSVQSQWCASGTHKLGVTASVSELSCRQVRVEIADLTNTCQHSRQGKRVGVELRPVQGAPGKLRLVLELQKQARLRCSTGTHTQVFEERFCEGRAQHATSCSWAAKTVAMC